MLFEARALGVQVPAAKKIRGQHLPVTKNRSNNNFEAVR